MTLLQFFLLFFFFFFEIYIYNIVLVSGIQKSDLDIYSFSDSFPL